MNKFLSVLLLSVVLFSCSPYQNALKSDDIAVKYEVATQMYEKGKYLNAIRLFEQMAPTYRGKPQAEKMFYMFAQSYYNTKQYGLAGYQFDSFVSSYPRSEKAEEAAFLSAMSYSKLSPVYSLDQINTFKAIDKLQGFINAYPDSQHLEVANATVKVLREKIEKKVFENAKNYNTISDYKSALIALDNFIADYPGTPFKEDALFYKLDSAYKLAINSVPSKMEERLNNAKVAYTNLMKFDGSTKYKSQADAMLARIETDLKQYIK
ncbi:MAG: outer membrane protein assembly factor BamD [Flavobacterium sp.]|nr:outer membrane protein assembly factor BamD [Flavobacterium sp.]